ncbi:MAG: hypothetical protein HND51_16320 [Chloroflexi bacterium]|nr:hypothetical protein [Chloroflexota bacterium]
MSAKPSVEDTQPMKATPDPLPIIESLWSEKHPGQSEINLRGLLPAAKARGDQTYLAELLTVISRSLTMQGKTKIARKSLSTVERLLTTDMPRVRVMYLIERGRVFANSNEPSKASILWRSAWKVARDLGEQELANQAAQLHATLKKERPDIRDTHNPRDTGGLKSSAVAG